MDLKKADFSRHVVLGLYSAKLNINFLILTKTYVVGTQKNRINETPKKYVKTDGQEKFTILRAKFLLILTFAETGSYFKLTEFDLVSCGYTSRGLYSA